MASVELAEARQLLGSLTQLVADPAATMDDYRQLYERVLAGFAPPDDAETEEVDAGGVPALWVSAPGTSREHVVVLIHGGAWCMGSAKGYREFGYRVSQAADARVLVVDYRLAPEHPFPAALDDTVAAYRFAREYPGVREVAFVGDSAGGSLVVAAMVRLRDEGDVLPVAAVACSPLVDLAGESASLTERGHLDPLPGPALIAMAAIYLAGADPKATPLASPLYADLDRLPPLRVLVGTDEVLHDDSVRLVDKVRAAGGQVELEIGEDMIHIWPVFPMLAEAHDSTRRFGEFLRKWFAAA